MERFEQQRTPDGLAVKMKQELFDRNLSENLKARKDIGFLLFPEATEQGEIIELRYNLSGMTSVNEAADSMTDEAFLRSLETLTDCLLSLPEYGLDIGQIMTAMDRVMLSEGDVKLICLCTQPDAREKANATRSVLLQIKQLAAERQGLEELNSLLANPYCSVQAIQGRLRKMNEAQPATSTSQVNPVSQVPVESPVKAPQAGVQPEVPQPAAFNPVHSADQPATSAPASDQPAFSNQPVFTPMNGGNPFSQASAPFVPMSGPAVPQPAQPAPRTTAEPVMSEPSPQLRMDSSIHFGINEQTMVEETPGFGSIGPGSANEATVAEFPSPSSYQASSPDEMTVVEGQQPAAGRRDMNAPTPSGTEGGNPEREEKKEKDRKSKPEKPEKKKKAKPEPARRPQTYEERKSFFWQNMIKLAGIVAVAVFLGIIAGAFLSSAALIVVILLAAVLITFLLSRGYLTLSWPKKPEPGKTPPTAPDVEDVFTVRLRLISQNLATRQEVIIRENDQIIGSDPNVCRVPVNQRGVSRRHCKISCVRTSGHEEYFITDLDSKNGTHLNGEKMEPNVAYPLKLGDHVILAGKYDFRVGSDAY